MSINLLPFNDASYKLIVDRGYSFVTIEPKIDKKYASFLHERELQLLKAVKKRDRSPGSAPCESVSSEVVKAFLQDAGMDYFIILT